MQQIYRRTLMMKCDFNKVALSLHSIHHIRVYNLRNQFVKNKLCYLIITNLKHYLRYEDAPHSIILRALMLICLNNPDIQINIS